MLKLLILLDATQILGYLDSILKNLAAHPEISFVIKWLLFGGLFWLSFHYAMKILKFVYKMKIKNKEREDSKEIDLECKKCMDRSISTFTRIETMVKYYFESK
jgi:hypothetical protein